MFTKIVNQTYVDLFLFFLTLINVNPIRVQPGKNRSNNEQNGSNMIVQLMETNEEFEFFKSFPFILQTRLDFPHSEASKYISSGRNTENAKILTLCQTDFEK